VRSTGCGQIHPAQRRHEQLRLRPGAPRRVERREGLRHVGEPEGRGVGGRGAGPELGGGVAGVGVAAPGGADRLVGELRPRRAERRVQRRAADRQDAAVTAREGAPAEIRDGERQGLIGQRLEVVDEQPALLEAGARGAERLQDLSEGVEGIRGVVSGHLVWRPAPHGGYTRRGAPASGARRGAIARPPAWF